MRVPILTPSSAPTQASLTQPFLTLGVGWLLEWLALCISLLLLASACTNNLSNLTPSLSNGVNGAPPNTGTQNNTAAFGLSRVLLNTSSGVGNLIDLVGDGSGTFGNLCQPIGGGSPPAAGGIGSPCSCTYAYSSPTTPNVQIDSPVLYQETDLLRCSTAAIPSTVSTVTISVHLTTANTYSNTVSFNLATNGIAFDSTNPSNFVSPVRYQCRDIINVFYMLDGSMYDPFQSEDPHQTFPLDFYTINLGLAAEAYIDAFNNAPGLQYWNCPTVLNPSLYLLGSSNDPSSPLSVYNAYNYTNMKVFSKAPLNGDSLIYPPSGTTNDRSTFYVATSPGGAFTVPVNALLAPGVNTSSTAVTQLAQAPLGYGASPIPIGYGTSSETCPDTSVPIPSGFHWMKLWLFRAGLTQRASAVSTALTTQVQSITCNPGDWAYAAAPSTLAGPVFFGCYASQADVLVVGNGYTASKDAAGTTDADNLYFSLGLNQVNNTSIFLADRWLGGTSQCVHLQSPNTGVKKPCEYPGAQALPLPPLPGPACNITDPGTANETFDVWQVELPYNRDPLNALYQPAFSVGCGTYSGKDGVPTASTSTTPISAVSDPLGLCTATQLTGGLSSTGSLGDDRGTYLFPTTAVGPPLSPPFADTLYEGTGVIPVVSAYNDIVTQPIDKGGNRFDFLYVVSPPSVTLAAMQDTSGSAASLAYQPMRFKLATDCPGNDPGGPGCSSSNLIIYNMKLHDIGSNGDPPGNDPSRPGIFPICVLQPN